MKHLLSGISKANSALLENVNIQSSLSKVVSELGASTNVDRCYIFSNRYENAQLLIDYSYEWCKNGVAAQLGNPDLSGISYDLIPGVYDSLSVGEPFFGLVSASSNLFFKEIMESQGILAYLFVPIFYNNIFWGWMGYDDCSNENIWQTEEVDALYSVAKNIGLRLNREHTENAHLLAVERFDLSVKASQQGLWEWDIKNNKLHFSASYMEMMGFEQDAFEHSFENWKKWMLKTDFEVVEPILKAYLNKEIPGYSTEFRLLHKKGHYVWIKGSGVAKWDEGGNAVYMIGSHLDISELKYQQEYLEVQRNEFNRLLNSLGEAVFRLNSNNEITYLNQYWKEISGYFLHECLLKPISLYFIEEDVMLINDTIQQLKEAVTITNSIDVRLRQKTGSWRWVQMIVKEFGKPTEKDYFIAGSIIDIHDKKLAFEKEKELAELKSGFVSLTSHQFRTPLTVIFSNIELIELYAEKKDEQLLPKIYKSAEKIKGEIDRMTELMNNILLVGRYDSNQLQSNLKLIPLTPLIYAIVNTYFSNQIDSREIKIIEFGTINNVAIDEMLFTHVLTNIISNAFKYSEGSANPEVCIIDLKNCVEIVIKDYGIGIPPSELEKVFNSFYRATNTVSYQGSGLGLVVAKQFMELHNGSIKLESELGKGTQVILRLPYER